MECRVDELVDLFDLQVPLFIGVDGGDSDRFAVNFGPECGDLSRVLQSRSKQMRAKSESSETGREL